jgi:hypothetical protein
MTEPWGCPACKEKFTALSGFDAHRVGSHTAAHPHYGRSCLTPEQLRAKGYVLGARGWGIPLTQEQLDALRERFAP